jgi:hypothetical protein
VIALPPAMSTSRDAEAKAQRLFDVRTIERNIKKGMTNRKEYEKHLKALVDTADKVAPPEEHPDDDDDDSVELDDRGGGSGQAP